MVGDVMMTPFAPSARVARERVRMDHELRRVVAEIPRLAPSSCDVVPATVVGDPGGVRLIFRSLLRCALGRGAAADVSLRSLGDGYLFTVSGPANGGDRCEGAAPLDLEQSASLAVRMGGSIRSQVESDRSILEFWLAGS
jgi:hypothetical protein